MTLTDEQKMNIRLNLALNVKRTEGVEDLEKIYQWVIGPISSIVPVARIVTERQ